MAASNVPLLIFIAIDNRTCIAGIHHYYTSGHINISGIVRVYLLLANMFEKF